MQVFNDVLQLATHGLAVPDVGTTLIRVAVGLFFAISGYHKLFNKERHEKFTRTLTNDGVPHVWFMQWWVAGWEFVAGAMLLVGLFSAFSAFVLTIICIVACCCEASARVAAFHPIDKADVVDDYLYLQEVLYLLMLALILISGPGAFALDSVLFK